MNTFKTLREASQPKWRITFESKHKPVEVTAPGTAVAYKKAEKLAKKNQPEIASDAIGKTIKKLG